MTIPELRQIAEKALKPDQHFNANMESREFNIDRAIKTMNRNLSIEKEYRDAFHPARVLQILSDLERMREALEIVRDAAHSDGCGGLCWSDDAAYEAFDNARDCLASLSLTSGGASGKEEG